MMKDVFLTLFSVFSSIAFLLVSVLLGWFIVWKLFLSRFKFVRELLGGMNESSASQEKPKPKKTRRE